MIVNTKISIIEKSVDQNLKPLSILNFKNVQKTSAYMQV
jgi:hypothetical protein